MNSGSRERRWEKSLAHSQEKPNTNKNLPSVLKDSSVVVEMFLITIFNVPVSWIIWQQPRPGAPSSPGAQLSSGISFHILQEYVFPMWLLLSCTLYLPMSLSTLLFFLWSTSLNSFLRKIAWEAYYLRSYISGNVFSSSFITHLHSEVLYQIIFFHNFLLF